MSITYDGKAMTFRSLDENVDVRDVSRAFVTYTEAFWDGPRRRERLLVSSFQSLDLFKPQINLLMNWHNQ